MGRNDYSIVILPYYKKIDYVREYVVKIMHYFLGFPPYRSGGLTKYAMDLMESQVMDKNVVLALWPGQIIKLGNEPIIKKRKSILGIRNYEIINPLPVPLDEGINQFEAFTQKCKKKVYISFLEREKPDVIHLHTLMGLHKEFIDSAKELKIKTVYTSHDYFGLCPKVTLYRNESCCDNDDNCRKCLQCNINALSLRKIQILQSPVYRALKNTLLLKKVRKKHREVFWSKDNSVIIPMDDIDEAADKYRKLRAFYVNMYENIDLIHFNSTVSESVFKKYINIPNSKVLNISHKGIKDNRNNPRSKSNIIRILFLAQAKASKGFYVLKAALDELWDDGNKNFELRLFGQVFDKSPYMVINENGYQQSELPTIFSNADILVAPSIWYETFGFTVLEALSYGVPVIVSDHVGAKDLIDNVNCIVEAGDVEALKRAIESQVDKYCNVQIKEWKSFLAENMKLYGVD